MVTRRTWLYHTAALIVVILFSLLISAFFDHFGLSAWYWSILRYSLALAAGWYGAAWTKRLVDHVEKKRHAKERHDLGKHPRTYTVVNGELSQTPKDAL